MRFQSVLKNSPLQPFQFQNRFERKTTSDVESFSKFNPKNSPDQWRFTSDSRGVMRYEFESAEACRVPMGQNIVLDKS